MTKTIQLNFKIKVLI